MYARRCVASGVYQVYARRCMEPSGGSQGYRRKWEHCSGHSGGFMYSIGLKLVKMRGIWRPYEF